MKEKSVLIIARDLSTFVVRDIDILEKKYPVLTHIYKAKDGLFSNLASQAGLFFWLLRHIVRAQALYIWFADYHAFLPVLFANLFRKNAFVVEGGYDTVYLPEIRYGSYSNPLRGFCSSYAMKHATLNLPVSETLIPEIRARAPKARVRTLYTGYDPAVFKPAGNKEKIVLTVAGSNSFQRVRLKGLDVFAETAKRLPEYQFVIVGLGEKGKSFLEPLPENLISTEKLSQEELILWYQRASVYAQFSMREGLPNAVCEAMLCGCVPVGFNAGGIAIAIGNTGIVINEKTIENAVSAIREAMERLPELGLPARRHIMETFQKDKRETAILALMEDPLPKQ